MDRLLKPTIILVRFVAISLAMSSTAPSFAYAKNAVSIGVIGGERFAHVSAVDFEPIVFVDGRPFQIGTATVYVDDLSGTGAGWQVTIGLAGSDDTLMAADEQSTFILSVTLPRLIVGQGIDDAGGPFSSELVAGNLRQSRIIMSAQPGFGKGNYQMVVTIARALPGDPSALASELAISVTICAGS